MKKRVGAGTKTSLNSSMKQKFFSNGRAAYMAKPGPAYGNTGNHHQYFPALMARDKAYGQTSSRKGGKTAIEIQRGEQ